MTVGFCRGRPSRLEEQDAPMPERPDTPLPRTSDLAAIVGPREGLPPIYRDLIQRLARETIP
jgi:hypothetical protein